MITKREVFENIVKNKGCSISCYDCPYSKKNTGKNTCIVKELIRIGAMAILRMFRKKKKPLLSVGTKIRFEDGEVAKFEEITDGKDTVFILRFKDGRSSFLSSLVGKIWEFAE